MPQQGSTKLPNSIERLGDLRNRAIRGRILRRYDFNRRILGDSVEHSLTCNLAQDFRLLSLINLCDARKPPRIFFAGQHAEEKNGRLFCTRCPTSFAQASSTMYEHLRSCSLYNGIGVRRAQRKHHCRRCDNWFNGVSAFEAHCTDYYAEIDLFCGILSIRGLVVAGGRCPFCLADSTKSWLGRMQEYIDSDAFVRHISTHLPRLPSHLIIDCPHPLY